MWTWYGYITIQMSTDTSGSFLECILTYYAKFLNNVLAGPWWNERDDWNALGNITT